MTEKNLPKLFGSLVALDSEKHKNLRFKPIDNFAHAKNMHVVHTVLGEVPNLSNTYPLAFASTEDGTTMLIVVLGVEENKNAYIDNDNKWMAQYVPAYIQRYPFIGVTVEGEDKKVLCIDEKSPHFGSKDGEKLFDGTEPSELIKRALKVVEEYDFSEQQTRVFCEEVANANILEEWQENTEFGNLAFKRINVNALATLPEKKVSEWHKKGYLNIILNIVQSQRSWREIESRLRLLKNPENKK